MHFHYFTGILDLILLIHNIDKQIDAEINTIFKVNMSEPLFWGFANLLGGLSLDMLSELLFF